MTKQNTLRDHYQEITNRVLALLEQGTNPWRQGWDSAKIIDGGAPFNPTTKKRYRGINAFLLKIDPAFLQTGDPRYCSYNQAEQKKWHVKKGEKARLVYFYKKLIVADKNGESEGEDAKTKTIPMLRAYPVFHASQIEGIPAFEPPKVEDVPWRCPDAAGIILENSGADIREYKERAYYSPTGDFIGMPPRASFESMESWLSTALHELAHWTGHPDRLHRDLRSRFGEAAYAQEELRAEMASAFMCPEIGIRNDMGQHASYVESWIKALKNDKREIVRAAADAQAIADYCLSFHPGYKARLEVELREAAEREAAYEAVKETRTTPTAASKPLAPGI